MVPRIQGHPAVGRSTSLRPGVPVVVGVAAAVVLCVAAAAAEKADESASPAGSAAAQGSGAAKAVYPKSWKELEPQIRKDPLAFLQLAREWARAHIGEYICHFQKLERVGGELLKPEKMHMKFRSDPFSVYLKWVADPSKGQEAIYVDGKYKGKIQVHPSGILGLIFRRVGIDPKGKTALKHSRRPITMAGMINMISLVTRQCEEAHSRGDLTLTYEGLRTEGGRSVYVLKRVLPAGKGYPCEVLLIFIDTECLACVRTDAYDWDGELISHYCYTDIQINPGVTDKDFDPDNADYGFRLF